MSEQQQGDSIHDGIGTYDVVLLVEGSMSDTDARSVRSLHDEITDQVVYHLLLPLEDAAARIEASMGALGAGDVMSGSTLALSDIDIESVRKECQEQSAADLATSIASLEAAGGVAHGAVTGEPPVDALIAKVAEVDAREAIVVTRPHVVAEFFHVDWTSRARRKLGVPVLHLIERENFDEQAGGGEGISGF